jgi:hypothetical protein
VYNVASAVGKASAVVYDKEATKELLIKLKSIVLNS